ncbi:MAG: helix-turn-helix transcriptional regulator [Bacteroidales bacterium]
MKDRISQFIAYANITPAMFADKIGVQRSSISHIMAGRNKPSYDLTQKILLNFPLISAEWLLLGIGNMLKGNNNEFRNGVNIAREFTDVNSRAMIFNEKKEILHITIFYTDGTFDLFKSSSP